MKTIVITALVERDQQVHVAEDAVRVLCTLDLGKRLLDVQAATPGDKDGKGRREIVLTADVEASVDEAFAIGQEIVAHLAENLASIASPEWAVAFTGPSN